MQRSSLARRFVLVALAVAASLGGAPAADAQESVAVVGATIIDGTGSPPIRDGVIVVQGDRIAAVGPRSSVRVPAGARVIDAAGKHVIPASWTPTST